MMMRWRRDSPLDLYNLFLGFFLFFAPWLFAFTQSAQGDVWVSSLLVVLTSLVGIIAWEEWINIVLGCWLVASPWVLGFTGTRAMHYSIGIGASVAFLSALELWLIHYYDHSNAGQSQI